MKKLIILLGITFSLTLTSSAQFSISSSPGLNLNIPKGSYVAKSVSPMISFNLDYRLKKYFLRTGIEQVAFSTDLGGQITELSIPLYFGAKLKRSNIMQLAGFGYYLTFPYKFLDVQKQTYSTHGIGTFYEFRYYSTEKFFFGFGLDVKMDFVTSSTYNLSTKNNFYITLGFNFGKK